MGSVNFGNRGNRGTKKGDISKSKKERLGGLSVWSDKKQKRIKAKRWDDLRLQRG